MGNSSCSKQQEVSEAQETADLFATNAFNSSILRVKK